MSRLLVVILSVIIVAIAAYVVLSDSVFIATDDLRPGEPIVEDAAQIIEHTVEFFDDDELVAHATIETRLLEENLYQFRLNVVQHTDTRLQSLRVAFGNPSPDPVAQIPEPALSPPPGSPWPEFTYHRDVEANQIVLAMPDLGVHGQGSVTLDFYIGALLGQPDAPDPMQINLRLDLHKDQLINLTRQRADMEIEVSLP